MKASRWSGQFKSKIDGLTRRKPSWGCLNCIASFDTKTKDCPECGHAVQYFPSAKELRRYRNLQLMQRAKLISNLSTQPKFTVVINGILICTYSADFKYDQNDTTVIEDVKNTKNEKYQDPYFKLKKKLVEAVHGIHITITT